MLQESKSDFLRRAVALTMTSLVEVSTLALFYLSSDNVGNEVGQLNLSERLHRDLNQRKVFRPHTSA